MKREQVPGAAVAIVDGDTVIWAKGFGVADVTTKQPVTDSTVFGVQSISKMYTSLGFLKSGIKLDDKLVKVYPAFSMKSSYGSDQPRKITFRHLLSHWAGLPHEAPLGGNYDERYALLEDHIASLNGSWMKAPVGSRYSYSNVGVDLAGYALQLAAKKPFADYMRSEVLVPLGMTNSTFSFNAATDNSNFARGHIEGRPVPVMRIPMQPSGGMYSTAADMAKFLLSALRPGATRDTLSRMTEIQYPLKNQQAGYGLGLEIGELRGAKVLKHGGSGYGYSTMQAWVPAFKVGVVVLANAGDVGFSDTLARDVLDQMLELQGVKPTEKKQPASVPQSAAALRQLEGSYKTYSNVVSIVADGDRLFLQRGDRKSPLLAIRRGQFVTESGDTLTFTPDGKKVISFGEHGVDTWFLNARKGEPRGDFQPQWSRYVGSYRIGAYGNQFTTTISEQNGYLVSSRNGGTKLIPYGDGLFFTPDGESVIFRGEKMLFGNRPAIKIADEAPATTCGDYPAAQWTSWPSPEDAGWSSERLNATREYAVSIGSAAGMVIDRGKVLFQWGDVDRKFNVHSGRKSLLSALYGAFLDKGEVRLSSTLADWRIDDYPPPLTPQEKQATVRDLLEAASGVFHPAVYETADMIASKPKRGSHPHGTFWLYSNWDFNALGTIYERASDSTIFKEFKYRIAEPIGMQDFVPSDGEYVDGPESKHPAYPFRMTARDLARFGLLYLRNGSWCGRQVVSAQWVKESTTAHHVTNYKPRVGYGYLWWVNGDGSYFAWGTGGHYVLVIPQRHLVIVNRVNTDTPGKRIDDALFGEIVQRILAAKS